MQKLVKKIHENELGLIYECFLKGTLRYILDYTKMLQMTGGWIGVDQ